MPNNQSPYEFIMNSGAVPKQSKVPGLPSGGSKKQRLLIAAGAGILLIIIFSVLFSFLFSGGGNSEQTLKMVQQHKELLRVADIGVKESRSPEARNLATTTKLTLQSTEDAIVAIAKKDQKIDNKKLAGGKDTDTDALLEQALQRNSFDQVFTETLQIEIRAYLSQLRIVYKASSSNKDKQTITDLFNQLSKLVPSEAASQVGD